MSSQLDLYNTKCFKEVWVDTTSPSATAKQNFLTDFKASSFYDSTNFPDAALNKTYDLLFAKFANSPISGFTLEQWKLRLFVIMFDHLPTWNKKLTLQQTFRSYSEDQILKGSTQTFNQADADATSGINTQSIIQSAFIDHQSVNLNTKDRARAYNEYFTLLDENITPDYVNKFNDLFLKVILPQKPIYFEDVE